MAHEHVGGAVELAAEVLHLDEAARVGLAVPQARGPGARVQLDLRPGDRCTFLDARDERDAAVAVDRHADAEVGARDDLREVVALRVAPARVLLAAHVEEQQLARVAEQRREIDADFLDLLARVLRVELQLGLVLGHALRPRVVVVLEREREVRAQVLGLEAARADLDLLVAADAQVEDPAVPQLEHRGVLARHVEPELRVDGRHLEAGHERARERLSVGVLNARLDRDRVAGVAEELAGEVGRAAAADRELRDGRLDLQALLERRPDDAGAGVQAHAAAGLAVPLLAIGRAERQRRVGLELDRQRLRLVGPLAEHAARDLDAVAGVGPQRLARLEDDDARGLLALGRGPLGPLRRRERGQRHIRAPAAQRDAGAELVPADRLVKTEHDRRLELDVGRVVVGRARGERERRRRERPLDVFLERLAELRGHPGLDPRLVRGRERHAPLGFEHDHLRAEPADLSPGPGLDRQRHGLRAQIIDGRQRHHGLVEGHGHGVDEALITGRAEAQDFEGAGLRRLVGALAHSRRRRERQLDALADRRRRLWTFVRGLELGRVVRRLRLERRHTFPQIDRGRGLGCGALARRLARRFARWFRLGPRAGGERRGQEQDQHDPREQPEAGEGSVRSSERSGDGARGSGEGSPGRVSGGVGVQTNAHGPNYTEAPPGFARARGSRRVRSCPSMPPTNEGTRARSRAIAPPSALVDDAGEVHYGQFSGPVATINGHAYRLTDPF